MTCADLTGRHHHQRYALHRFAFGVNELVIDGNDFHIIAARFGDYGRPEFGIGRTDNKAFGSASRQAINGVKGFLTVGDGNFDDVET